ncbi:hypothetical protein IEO21_05760 [Rhodonia placenta]|uniref:Uncharacterized protein n=1 Tax=Rhodonia placenta TaxID=104341 RepID=A0A8H7P1R3_9APHY|nr:hypothetical protein IEO21_05760 [Postia placenta]
MTARDVCTVRDCPLRASLRPWTNAPRRRSHCCSNTILIEESDRVRSA